MASYGECLHSVGEAAEAAGRTLTESEIARVFARTEGLARRFQREGMDRLGATQRAGQELGMQLRVAAMVERRSAALNLLKRQALDARATPGSEARTVRQVLTGDQSTGLDAGRSIDAERHGLVAQLMGPMVAQLRKAGLLRALTKRDKAFDRDVARELWRMEDPAAGEATGNRHAEATAKILHQQQEVARALQNDAGAWIGKDGHYVTRQNHDMTKVRGDGSPDAYRAWRDAIEPKLDPRTFDRLDDPSAPAEREELLKNIWSNLSSGVHETSTGSTLAGFTGPGNLAKRISQERVLQFKDADSWFDYNEQYGHGAVIDGVMHGLERAARDTALMRTLGTNPEAMFKGWVDGLQRVARDRGDFKTVDALKSDWNERILDTVTGAANLPAHGGIAKIASTVRNVQALAKLGGVVLSSLPDLAVNASMLRHNGIGLLESYGRQVASLLPSGAGRREVADTLGVGIDGLLGHIVNRFRAEDGGLGKMSRAVELFHRLNGLSWWTDAMKEGAGVMLTNNLGRNASREFDALPGLLQTTLRRYGIEAAEWDAIRGGAEWARDGNMHLMPDSIDNPALRTKLQTYVIDQVREGMTEPTAGTITAGRWGTRSGTLAGELVRLLMQFKTYPMTFISRSLGREFTRDGADLAGIAHLIVATTTLGYVSMTLKELAKGRQPRDPQDTAGYAKVVMAAMTQGGGLGIYGDFLFGEANRAGGGPIASMLGPTVGTLDDAGKLFQALRDGAFKGDPGHTVAQGLQLVKNNTPFLNLFYTRAALDYLVLYRFQEAANPGYLRRYEAQVKKDNNQTFWLRPTEAVR